VATARSDSTFTLSQPASRIQPSPGASLIDRHNPVGRPACNLGIGVLDAEADALESPAAAGPATSSRAEELWVHPAIEASRSGGQVECLLDQGPELGLFGQAEVVWVCRPPQCKLA